jgi:Flp pilus assembly protein TadG
MNRKSKSPIRGFLHQTKGAVAVEFAIIGTLFFVLVAGIIDLGHAWYMQQVITNASREGARYGITYRTNDNGVRIAPNAITSPTIKNYVLNTSAQNSNKGGFGLKTLLPSDANPDVTFPTTTPEGYTTGSKGYPIQVKVTAVKHWFMISSFIPGFGDTKTLTASTIMLCE